MRELNCEGLQYPRESIGVTVTMKQMGQPDIFQQYKLNCEDNNKFNCPVSFNNVAVANKLI